MLREGAPARTDLQHAAARIERALVETEVELAPLGPLERFIGSFEDSLGVAARAAEKVEIEVRIQVVVRANSAGIRRHLAEHQRLHEAPQIVEGMKVGEVRPELVDREQVAV